MIVSINQPAYLPWLGYFDRIAKSDLHIILDHVQLEKNSFTNRNKIRTKDGSCWMTIPVKTKGLFGNLGINAVECSQVPNWRAKHLQSIITNYAKAPHFGTYITAIKEIYAREIHRLVDIIDPFTDYLLQVFGLTTPLIKSSTLNHAGKKSDLVLNLCKEVGAKTYLSGPFGRDYLDEPSFTGAGIKITYHDYHHPTYQQTYPGFEPYMGAIDLLLNEGGNSRKIINNES